MSLTRKLSRGIKRKPITLLKKLRKLERETAHGEKSEAVKTHLWNMVIAPEMIGSFMVVYNGKQYINVEIKSDKMEHLEEIFEAQLEMKKVILSRKEENKDFQVKKMIKDFIVELMEEANEEAEHQIWCNTETSTNEQT